MKYNTNLDVATFIAITNQIAYSYFDENNVYSPAIGKVMSMCIFFNACVDKRGFDERYKDGIKELSDIDGIMNADFVRAYNSAIEWDGEALNFANAYIAANDVVEAKKTSVGYIADIVTNAISKITASINENMNEETMENLKEIAKSIGNSNDIGEAVVKAYGKLNFLDK